jgi:hypothetical protein
LNPRLVLLIVPSRVMISKYRPKIISGEIFGTSLTLSLKQCIRNSVVITGPLILYLLPSTKGTIWKFFGTFLNLSLKLMQWYVTSVSRGSLYEKVGNKCMKILKFWRTELSYAENKNRGKKMLRLGMDTFPSLNDIMKIRCNKCTRSKQGYDF